MHRGLLDRILFALFLFLLLWAPLPLASNRSWALAFLAAGLWLVLAAAVARKWWQSESIEDCLATARLPLVCLSAFCALVLIQTLPLPARLLGLVMPDPGSGDIVTGDLYATRQYLLASLAYLAGFLLVLLLANSSRRVLWVAGALLLSGVLQAFIAIFLYAAQASYVFLFLPFEHIGRASGTFANWDHLAGYLELCLSIGIGLMLARMEGQYEQRKTTRRDNLLAFLRFVMSEKMLIRLLLVVMVIALVLSHSRMGNSAFFISLLFVGSLAMVRNRQLRKGAFWLVVSLVAVDVAIVGQWVGIERVMSRLQDTSIASVHSQGEETLEQRVEPARQSLSMIAERPWMGFGGGTYFSVFPKYKGAGLPAYYDHAHNDLVEISVDAGLLGCALLCVLVVLSAGRIRTLFGRKQDRISRGIAFGAAMAISCLVIHGLVDFNFQIPANALTFVVILALVWVIVPRRETSHERLSA